MYYPDSIIMYPLFLYRLRDVQILFLQVLNLGYQVTFKKTLVAFSQSLVRY